MISQYCILTPMTSQGHNMCINISHCYLNVSEPVCFKCVIMYLFKKSFIAPHKLRCIIFPLTPVIFEGQSRSHLYGDITMSLDYLKAIWLRYNMLKFYEDVIYFHTFMKVIREKIIMCPLASMEMMPLTPTTYQKL